MFRLDDYKTIEDDVNFWYNQYCYDVDAGINNPDVGIVDYITEKIDNEYPTDSMDQFESLRKEITRVLRKNGIIKDPWVMSESKKALLRRNKRNQKIKEIKSRILNKRFTEAKNKVGLRHLNRINEGKKSFEEAYKDYFNMD